MGVIQTQVKNDGTPIPENIPTWVQNTAPINVSVFTNDSNYISNVDINIGNVVYFQNLYSTVSSINSNLSAQVSILSGQINTLSYTTSNTFNNIYSNISSVNSFVQSVSNSLSISNNVLTSNITSLGNAVTNCYNYISNTNTILSGQVANVNSRLNNVAYIGNNVSIFSNDKAYQNVSQVQSTVSNALSNAVFYSNISSISVQSLANTSNIIYRNSNVSLLINDVGYITVANLSSNIVYYGNLSAIDVRKLSNTGNILFSGSNISSLTNNSGYLTNNTSPVFNSITINGTANVGTVLNAPIVNSIDLYATDEYVSNSITIGIEPNVMILEVVVGRDGNSGLKIAQDVLGGVSLIADGLGIAMGVGSAIKSMFNSDGTPSQLQEEAVPSAVDWSTLHNAPLGYRGTIVKDVGIQNHLYFGGSLYYDNSYTDITENPITGSVLFTGTGGGVKIIDGQSQSGIFNTLTTGDVVCSANVKTDDIRAYTPGTPLYIFQDINAQGNISSQLSITATKDISSNANISGTWVKGTFVQSANVLTNYLTANSITVAGGGGFGSLTTSNLYSTSGTVGNLSTNNINSDIKLYGNVVSYKNTSMYGSVLANSLTVLANTDFYGNINSLTNLTMNGNLYTSGNVIANNFYIGVQNLKSYIQNVSPVSNIWTKSGNVVSTPSNVSVSNLSITNLTSSASNNTILVYSNVVFVGCSLTIDPADLQVDLDAIILGNIFCYTDVVVSQDVLAQNVYSNGNLLVSSQFTGVSGGNLSTRANVSILGNLSVSNQFYIGTQNLQSYILSTVGNTQISVSNITSTTSYATNIYSNVITSNNIYSNNIYINNQNLATYIQSVSGNTSLLVSNVYLQSTYVNNAYLQSNFVANNSNYASNTYIQNRFVANNSSYNLSCGTVNASAVSVASLTNSGTISMGSPGVNVFMGVNSTGNRQIWFQDSTASVNNSTAAVRFGLGTGNTTYLSGVSTDNSVVLPITIDGKVIIPGYLNLVNASNFTGKTSQLNNDANFLTSVSSTAIPGINSTGTVAINQASGSATLDVSGSLRNTGFHQQSFVRAGMGTSSNVVGNIASFTGSTGSYSFDVDVITTSGYPCHLSYKIAAGWNSTSGAWNRCIPLSESIYSNTAEAFELQFNNPGYVNTFRLVHSVVTGGISQGVTVNIKCKYYSGDVPTVVDLTGQATTTDANWATYSYHRGTALSQYNNQVGVNTIYPSYTLDVNGNGRIKNTLISDSSYGNFAGFQHYSVPGAGNYALLQSSGGLTYLGCSSGQNIYFGSNNSYFGNWSTSGLRVGDGTAASYTLDVNGTGRFTGATTFQGQMNLSGNNAMTFNTNSVIESTGAAGSSDLCLWAYGGYGIRILPSTGYVGIGGATSITGFTPSYTLDVSGSARFTGTTYVATLMGQNTSQNSNDTLYIGPAGATNVFIDRSGSGGQFVYGYNTPKGTTQSAIYQIYNNSTDRLLMFQISTAGTSSGSNYINMNTSVAVGSGSAPSYTLDVSGTFRNTGNTNLGGSGLIVTSGGGGTDCYYNFYAHAKATVNTTTLLNNSVLCVAGNTYTTALQVGNYSTSSLAGASLNTGIVQISNQASTLGPHYASYTNVDNYPLIQMLSYAHDNIYWCADVFWDGAWKHSTSSMYNWRMGKVSGKFKFDVANGTAGSAASFFTVMQLNNSGVFINATTSPSGNNYDLEVFGNAYCGGTWYATGTGNSITVGTVGYLTTSGVATGTFGTSAYYNFVGGRGRFTQVDCFSDKFLKKNIQITDTAKDLQTIINLPLKRFDYIDEIQHREKEHIGIVAQDVENIPELKDVVQEHKGYIPDFYKLVDIVEIDSTCFTIIGDLEYADDTKVRFIYDNDGKETTSHGIVKGGNIVHKHGKLSATSVFLYGKEIQNVKSVNYNTLYTHGLSAIQELHKIITEQQKQIDIIQKELRELKKYKYTVGI